MHQGFVTSTLTLLVVSPAQVGGTVARVVTCNAGDSVAESSLMDNVEQSCYKPQAAYSCVASHAPTAHSW